MGAEVYRPQRMTLFSIPDFVKGWREASFEVKQLTMIRILASSYFVGFSAAAGKAFVAGAGSLVGVGAGLLAGAACAALAAVAMGLPIAIPKFLYDEMAKDEMRNAENAPTEKKK